MTSLRVIDGEGMRVWAATVTSYQHLPSEPRASAILYSSFGGVDVADPVVMVPSVGFFRPGAVDADQGAVVLGRDAAAVLASLEPDESLVDPVVLEVYTEALDDAGDARTDQDSVTVNVSGDVTFASDSAELSGDADAVLQGVADTIGQYSGGSLSVVGHTDDVADNAYNQTLSEKRAKAVADRLGELTDVSGWDVSVSGKGESEPRSSGTSDEARAINRRVEIVVTPTGGTKGGSQTDLSSSADLPKASGPVAAGAEGVTVSSSKAEQGRIDLLEVIRVGGLLLATFEATGSTAGDDALVLNSWFGRDPTKRFSSVRGEDSYLINSLGADGVTVLSGGQRWHPVDYLVSGAEAHVALAQPNLIGKLEDGLKQTVCVALPDTGEDSVVVDHAGTDSATTSMPWRLTDVAVVDA